MSFTSNLDLLNRDVKLCSEKLAVINRRYCIKEYGQQYHRFFRQYYSSLGNNTYIFNGPGLSSRELADSIVGDVNEEEISEITISFTAVSFYKQIIHGIRNQKQGQVLIFRAHDLDDETARLIDQLAYTARKHDWDWSFILIGDSRKLAQNLPRRFIRHYPIPNLIIKGQGDKKRTPKMTALSWAAIIGAVVLLLALVFLLINIFVSEDRVQVNTSIEQNKELQIESKENQDIDNEGLSPDIPEETLSAFEKRLQEWEGFKQNEVAAVSNEAAPIGSEAPPVNDIALSQSAGLRMSAIIEEAFEQRDTAALLKWFRINPVDVIDSKGQTALIRSLSLPSNDIFELLLERGANFNRGGVAGRTPLMYASIYGNLEAVANLLDKGADPDQVSHFNKTALMASVHNKYFEISELLLEKSADPDIQDHSGWTALFYAVWNRDQVMESLLLNAGADSEIKDGQGLDIDNVRRTRSQDEG